MAVLDKYTTVGDMPFFNGTRKFIQYICNPEAVSGCPVYALDSFSILWAWGVDGSSYGVLGNGSASSSSVPVSVFGGPWKKIVCTGSSVLALDTSSYVWAWGYNGNGQLGDNTTSNRSSPVSIGFKFLDIITSNSGTSYALDASSYMWSWGYNSYGAVGDGTTTNRSSPVSVIGSRRWRLFPSIDGVLPSSGYIIALDYTSFAWAWGNAGNGYLGDYATRNRSSPVSVYQTSGVPNQWLKINSYRAGLGGYMTDSSSYLWGWGTTFLGNTSVGGNLTSIPISVMGANKYIKVMSFVPNSVGGTCNAAVDISSYLWQWGYMGNNGNFITEASPVSMNTLGHPVIPSTVNIWGDNNPTNTSTALTIMALSSDTSQILAWGSNYYGEFGGSASGGSISAPATITPISATFKNMLIEPITLGAACLAVDSSSNLWSWGTNAYYTGNTSSNPSFVGTQVPRLNVLGN